ncbi:MAG: DUF503 domain-containing protein [Syntrophomonadaceae bacterium]|jgi:uncharacterized protein YlxP (DUF503 family)|nr:DUF503 domain-containing protein [Syntrophomonadaceae bacterium]
MIAICGTVELYLPYAQSLKEKRQITKSINDRIRKRFNLSIAEVDGQELWQRATLGFAAVTNTQRDMDRVIEALRDTLDLHEEEIQVLAFDYSYIG